VRMLASTATVTGRGTTRVDTSVRGPSEALAMTPKSFGRGPPSVVDSQFTEDSEVMDFNEQVWRVLRERGHRRSAT